MLGTAFNLIPCLNDKNDIHITCNKVEPTQKQMKHLTVIKAHLHYPLLREKSI